MNYLIILIKLKVSVVFCAGQCISIYFFLNLEVIQLKLLEDLAQISLPAYEDCLFRQC
jgi:hypothetical protein